MATADARMEFRVRSDIKARIERAADLVDEPVSSFTRSAAEERADSVIRQHEATTIVPDLFFDELLTALETPPRANARLSKAARRAEQDVVRR